MSFDDPLWIQSDGTAPVYSAREDRTLISAIWKSEGVISGLRVKQRVAGAQMRVQVEDGNFVIQGDDSTSPPQNKYLGNWTDDAVDANMPSFSAAPGSGSRRDLVCVRVNDPTHGGPAGRNTTFVVVTGTPHATTPVLPAVPSSAIPIAEVLVATGTTSITNAMITDLRQPARVAGELPIGTILDYAGPEAELSTYYPDFVPADGRAINRLTYFGYMRRVGTAHGAGDGTTTVNVIDARGRVTVALDNMGGSDAGRLNVANTLGASGGQQLMTITSANLPPHTHGMQNHTHSIAHDHSPTPSSVSVVNGSGSQIQWLNNNIPVGSPAGLSASLITFAGGTSMFVEIPAYSGASGGPSVASTTDGGFANTATDNMQPYILVNKIVKVA